MPFQKHSHDVVKKVMLQEDNTAYKLSYKTGWGLGNNGEQTGWVIGWIEENNHVYFFVTFIKTPNQDINIADARMKITKAILADYGFFKGEM